MIYFICHLYSHTCTHFVNNCHYVGVRVTHEDKLTLNSHFLLYLMVKFNNAPSFSHI